MGMLTETQILRSTQDTNAILAELLGEVRRTNDLLERLGRVVQAPEELKPTAPNPT